MPRRSSRGERASAACPGHARLRDAQPGSSTDEEQPPMTTSFTAALRESARPTWDRAVGHRFVTELHDGSIADDTMAAYLIQDNRFLDSLVRKSTRLNSSYVY